MKQPGSKSSIRRPEEKPRPWSKIQKELYNLLDPNAELQAHCSVHRMESQYGSKDLPRFFITLGYGDSQEVIFDYPKDFPEVAEKNFYPYESGSFSKYWQYSPGHFTKSFASTIREYVDTSKDELLTLDLKDDNLGLINIFKCADRRLGRRSKDKLAALILTSDVKNKELCIKILNKRFKK
jgi:hypothetical protein